MKVIILAGGFGTRLSEYTEHTPKPMVEVADRPILWHIMDHYSHFGHKDFFVALGYKANVIKEYFINYDLKNSDIEVDLSKGSVSALSRHNVDWKVTLVDTGLETMTGGRVKRMERFIDDDVCLLTYEDGVCDVDINKLVEFHRSHGKMVTVTAVHPTARFGEIEISDDGIVSSFREKPNTGQGWINGGYFVVNREFFNYIGNDQTVLEGEPLETISKIGELRAYVHDGLWRCMDTKRDRDNLDALLVSMGGGLHV